MTAEYVEFHAAARPDAVAIVHNSRDITYGTFARDIRTCVGALREFGLMPGDSVAINCGDFYFEWLLRLACEELSLVSARLIASDTRNVLPELRQFDLVLSSSPVDPSKVGRWHAVTSEWCREILARPDAGPAPASVKADDDPVSMVYTSGTTGTPKRVLLTRGIFQRRAQKLMWFMGLTPASRYLVAVQSAARTHAACVWAGATVVIEDRMSVSEAIAAHGITHVSLPPIALKQTLDALPKGFEKPRELTIFSFGAPISRALRDAALERLATDVRDLYGLNEVGFVSSRTASEFGSIWPGVRIEIVDDRDKPVPDGEAGWIRIQTDCMVHGYVDDPEASSRMFKDGWFYTQDLGRLRGDRQFQIIGRGDDVLNIGWRKVAPSELEDLVLNSVPVGDVAICSIVNPEGIEQICVALSGPRAGDQEILARINRAFDRLQIGKFHVLKLDRIPRNTNGKVQRGELKRLAAAVAQSR